APRSAKWTYDAKGRVLTVDGYRTDIVDVSKFTYYPDDDADVGRRGQPATAQNAVGHSTNVTSYDAHGRPLTFANANGTVTKLTYDKRGRIVAQERGGAKTEFVRNAAGL